MLSGVGAGDNLPLGGVAGVEEVDVGLVGGGEVSLSRGQWTGSRAQMAGGLHLERVIGGFLEERR